MQAIQKKDKEETLGATQGNYQEKAASGHSRKKAKLIAALDNILDSGTDDIDEETLSQCVKLRRSLDRKTKTIANQSESVLENPSQQDWSTKNLHEGLGSLANLTPWTRGSIPPLSAPPPLPSIKEPSLETATFIHGGTVTHENPDSYERLEWLGDAYIYLLSTHLIYHTFTTHTPGRMAQFRERIVKNETLASYARSYNFHKKVILPPDRRNLPPDAKPLVKIFGDVFEAYAGAVILSDPEGGLDHAAAWLKSLWAGSLAPDILAQERRNVEAATVALSAASSPSRSSQVVQLSLPAKDRLQAAIGCKGMKLYYKDCGPEKTDRHSGLPLFTVGLYLDDSNEDGVTGKQMSFGSGLSKKDAGQKAAEMMIANKKMMKYYEERKKRFEEELKKQKEAELGD